MFEPDVPKRRDRGKKTDLMLTIPTCMSCVGVDALAVGAADIQLRSCISGFYTPHDLLSIILAIILARESVLECLFQFISVYIDKTPVRMNAWLLARAACWSCLQCVHRLHKHI